MKTPDHPIAWIADVHAGNHKRFAGATEAGMNQRCRQVLTSLQLAFERARAEGSRTMVVLGDLFDTARPEPQIVAEVQRIFATMDRTLVLLGNHEMVSSAPGDHALGPLGPVRGVEVVERPAIFPGGDCAADIVLVPFRPGPAREWLPQDLEALLGKKKRQTRPRVLGIHLGLEHDETPHFLRGTHDSVTVRQLETLMEEFGIIAAIAGNWHTRRMFAGLNSRQIMQCGSLAPTGWDNPGDEGYGTVAFFRPHPPDWLTWDEIPGPRFLTATDGAEPKLGDLGPGWARYLRRSVADPDQLGGAARIMEDAVAQGLLAGGEATLDDTAAKKAAQSAAKAARSAVTLAEAVTAYVAQIPEEDREWVRERVLRALGVGGA